MKIWKRFGIKELLVVGLAVVTGIAIVVGTVYAVNPAYAYQVSTSNVVLWGFGNNNILIDPEGNVGGDMQTNQSLSGKTFYYGQGTKAGLFSGAGTMVNGSTHEWKDRAEAAVGRMDIEGDDEAANAWIQSSGGAKVLVQYDGDIIVTLGN